MHFQFQRARALYLSGVLPPFSPWFSGPSIWHILASILGNSLQKRAKSLIFVTFDRYYEVEFMKLLTWDEGPLEDPERAPKCPKMTELQQIWYFLHFYFTKITCKTYF